VTATCTPAKQQKILGENNKINHFGLVSHPKRNTHITVPNSFNFEDFPVLCQHVKALVQCLKQGEHLLWLSFRTPSSKTLQHEKETQ
jgi:hypothetical protein